MRQQKWLKPVLPRLKYQAGIARSEVPLEEQQQEKKTIRYEVAPILSDLAVMSYITHHNGMIIPVIMTSICSHFNKDNRSLKEIQ